ncbi:MAG: ATP-dependent DNA ligase [Candidatus Micrarchaeota archaeon]|nr:ATP-dependent DNA ligase [Candidatus Micrarchaeota archaeon]
MLFSELSKYYEKLEGTSSRLSMIDILTEMFKMAKEGEVTPIVYMTQGSLAPSFKSLQMGLAEKFAAEAIGMSAGRSKEEVLKEYKKSGDMGLTAEEFAKKARIKRMKSEHFSVSDVFERMLKIAKTSGQGSQDTKIKHLVVLLSSSEPLDNKYLIRFALGQLRLGVGDATILEALSSAFTGSRDFKAELEDAYNKCGDLGKVGDLIARKGERGVKGLKVELFSPVRPALAERLPTSEQILEKMHGRCAVESKYDGLRAQLHIDRKNRRVEIFSRNLEVLTPMLPEIARAALHEVKADEAIIEGEAIAYNDSTGEFRPFQETIQRKRKHGIEEMSETMPLTLFAFDIMYLDGEDYLDRSYEERRRKLESIITPKGRIRPSDKIVATTAKEIDTYFENMVGDGLEGIVAKDLGARYVAGARKFSWIKLKRSYRGELSDTLDLVIVGYYLGRGQRAEFRFGGLLTAVYNEKRDMFETITRIGTGFSEKMMTELEQRLSRIKVKNRPARVDAVVDADFWVEPRFVITVRADEITKSPMHTCGKDSTDTGYALRFPRIISDGVRDDKSPEDATTTKEVIEMYGMQKRTRLGEK